MITEQYYTGEYNKCATDPIYFIQKYFKIRTNKDTVIDFDLKDFQKNTLNDIIRHDKVIIIKSRQVGMTTMFAAYALWNSIFDKNSQTAILTLNKGIRQHIYELLTTAELNLPFFFKVPDILPISVYLNANDIGDGRYSLVLVDEAAHIQNIERLLLSHIPKLIMASTLNPTDTRYLDIYENFTDSFHKFKLPYYVDEYKDLVFKKRMFDMLGEKSANIELMCKYG